MHTITDDQVAAYMERNIGAFHDKRLESLHRLQLRELLRRKNPYLFRAKKIVAAPDWARSLLDAHLISQEETLFGGFLEGLALYVAGVVHNGFKSAATGIDLEFAKADQRYIVAIKSGPNWGNSGQKEKMKDNFKAAARVLRQGHPEINVVAVNGCCYGRDRKPDKGEYFKYCGQAFWQLLSNDADFYLRIMQPLGPEAQRPNDEFAVRYEAVVQRLAQELSDQFCRATGEIDWRQLASFNSADYA